MEKSGLTYNFWSESFSIRNSKGRAPAFELVLLRGGQLSEIALQGEASSPKLCIEVQSCKIFSAHNEQCSMKKWFPEKTGKHFD